MERLCSRMQPVSLAVTLLASAYVPASNTNPRYHAHNETLLLNVVRFDGLIVLEYLA